MQFTKEYWCDGAVEVDFLPGPLQEELPITAVSAFTFTSPGRMVLTKNHRGWEHPGGHVEAGETVLEALHREIAEEIAGKITHEPILLGHRYTRQLRPHPQNDKYPERAVLPIYLAFVELSDFMPQFEVTARTEVDYEKAIELYHEWTPQRDEIFAHAKQNHTQFFFE